MDPQTVVDKYKSYGVTLDEPMVIKAIEFAVKYHGSQKRASGEPYYYHPLQVAEIIAQMRLDSDSIVTAILHDTIEDTDLTFEDIQKNFSPDIAKLVDGVTKLTKIEFTPNNVRQAENFRKLLLAMSNDIRVLLVKLADRLHNMRTIEFISSHDKRKRIALETMEITIPLAERIGVQQIKTELQDICFRVLNPEVRSSILNRFHNIENGREDFVKKIVAEIKETVCEDGFEVDVSGRRKTPYSTWMKMKQKDVGLDQLSDIVAFRVIVNSIEDCYKVLGVVHAAYKMVPGHFQDFISTPKTNGYKSLHTVVIGPLMQKIEIQIRTQEMHDIAELGVAAHWRYKQNHKDASDGLQYTWIRELLSMLEKDNAIPEDFLQNTKMAMYYDQVFCFTPMGQLVALPKGASTVDFAYMVHSDVGNSCVGAKVNGRIVPLRTQLLNGDQVEIITSKNHTASPSWEKFVVTGKARSEIRKLIRVKNKDQYTKLGTNIITKALHSAGIKEEAALERACQFFQKTKEELFFAIGEGTITREEVVEQAQPKKSKLSSTLSILKFGTKKKRKETKHEDRVPIKGLISGMAMHYAKCCHPLPGDKIVGIIHTGSGVTIHTSDCSMLNNFAGMPERIIDLAWDDNLSNIPFICRINLILLNEPSGLAVVSAEVARDAGNIINFKITNRHSEYFEMNFDIEVNSVEHIETIINSLRTKKVVQSVERAKY